MSAAEDTFVGTLELTATEMAYVTRALVDHYARGGWCPASAPNRRDFSKQVLKKFRALELKLAEKGAVR